jgi:hypothetical protein
MLMKTIVIDNELNNQIKAAVQDERVKKALVKRAGYRNAGEGELIRRALRTGLLIELRKLTRQTIIEPVQE